MLHSRVKKGTEHVYINNEDRLPLSMSVDSDLVLRLGVYAS